MRLHSRSECRSECKDISGIHYQVEGKALSKKQPPRVVPQAIKLVSPRRTKGWHNAG